MGSQESLSEKTYRRKLILTLRSSNYKKNNCLESLIDDDLFFFKLEDRIVRISFRRYVFFR